MIACLFIIANEFLSEPDVKQVLKSVGLSPERISLFEQGYINRKSQCLELFINILLLTTGKLLADPRWEKLLRDLMLEVIAAAGALGFEIPASYAEEQIERTRTMGAYKAFPFFFNPL